MSAVPSAIEVVLNLVHLVLPNVKLLDGPGERIRANQMPEGVWPDQDVIAVGWSPVGAGASITPDLAGLGRDQEAIDVECFISCVSGEMSVKTVRDRAFGFYDSINAQVLKDRTLGRTVAGARMSRVAYTPFLDLESGAAAEVVFTISCVA